MGSRGFCSFRAIQSGLSLNIDVSTTMIVKPGPVAEFLLAKQKVDHPNKIDWFKVLEHSRYDTEPMLSTCGKLIAQGFTQVAGRVLQPRKLKAGNGEDIFTRNGRWNFSNKRLVRASCVEKWSVVNFSAWCNVKDLVRDLIKLGKVDPPFLNYYRKYARALQREKKIHKHKKTQNHLTSSHTA